MAAFSRFERPGVEKDRAFVPRVPQRGVALYLQVADYLCGRIETGKLSPGDQLPPETGDDVLRISALRCDENDVVFGYINVYIHTIFAEDLSPETIHNMPIYAQIERKTGIEVVGVEQRITAVGASAALVKHLGLKRGEPVLRITRLYYEESGRPVEFAESFHHSSAYEYLIHLRKEI
jgi:GntR family transcriptional regulator